MGKVIWLAIVALLVSGLFVCLVGFGLEEKPEHRTSDPGSEEWRSRFDVSSGGEVVTLIAFFLAFNPVCIGLIVGFAYQYVEALRTQVHGMQMHPNYRNICDKELDTYISSIKQYTDCADLLVFDAGLFWLFGMVIGALMLAHHFRFIADRFWFASVLLMAVALHVVLRVYAWRQHKAFSRRGPKRKKLAEEARQQQKIDNRWIVGTWFSLFMVDAIVLGGMSCGRLRFSGFWIFAVLLSAVYLGLWFFLAAQYMPSSNLQFLRDGLFMASPSGSDTRDRPNHR